MFVHKKALYNMIQLGLIQIPETEVQLEPWQKENYRAYSLSELFESLDQLGFPMSEAGFKVAAASFETPEDFSESMTKDLLPLDQDRVYLLFFELWKRLCPEKQSLTVFCDELDYQITLYERERTFATPEIQDTVANFQQVLDKNVDQGASISQALSLLQSFCANPLEAFLYNYISDRIEEENDSYAKELLDGFKKYVTSRPFFSFLSLRIEISEDPETGYEKLEKLIRTIKEGSQLELGFDILTFLARTGNHSLFINLATKMLPLLKVEEDLRDFALIASQHFAYLDLYSLSQSIDHLLDKRASIPEGSAVSTEDSDFIELQSILQQKLHLA